MTLIAMSDEHETLGWYLFEIIPGKWFYALKIYLLCSHISTPFIHNMPTLPWWSIIVHGK